MAPARFQLYGYREEVHPGYMRVIDPGVEDNQCFICRGAFDRKRPRVFINWRGGDRLYFLRTHQDCMEAMTAEKAQEVLANAVVLDQELWAGLMCNTTRLN